MPGILIQVVQVTSDNIEVSVHQNVNVIPDGQKREIVGIMAVSRDLQEGTLTDYRLECRTSKGVD